MPFDIRYSAKAQSHLDALRRFDQLVVADAIETQLRHQPTSPSRHRKPMRSDLISAWELRVGNFRVYYDVDERANAVDVQAIGEKIHNRLFIAGEEFDLP
jgi:mRNA-degrading endonuclease RelE of RelBE toxin-antitoxin system